MGKKWDKMDGYERMMATKELSKFYGVEDAKSNRPGEFYGGPSRSHYEVNKDLSEAMGTDYDVREYLRHTGGEIPSNAKEVYNLHREMKKDHKANRGGAYNSRSDMKGVSDRAYASAMDKFKSKILDSIPEDDEQTEAAVEPVTEEPYTPSETLTDAQDILDQDEFSPFGSAADEQAAAAAQKQLGDFKLNIQGGLFGAGIPTRGAGAPGTPGGFKS